jgi:protein-disulfide isomerase
MRVGHGKGFRQRSLDLVLVGVAILIGGLVVRRELFPHRPPTMVPRAEVPLSIDSIAQPTEWTASQLRFGDVNAGIQLVVFSDFSCPFCRNLAGTLDSLLATHDGGIDVVLKNLPTSTHQAWSYEAASAAVCASQQARFKPMYDRLFQVQDSTVKPAWGALARQAGVTDTLAFVECLAADQTLALVLKDINHAALVGESATPVLLLNGHVVRGSLTGRSLAKLLDAQFQREGESVKSQRD